MSHFSGCVARPNNAGGPSPADVRAEHGAMTEEEIDAALNDDDFDLELEQLRLSRLQEIKESVTASTRKGGDDENKSAGAKRGSLSALSPDLLLDLAFSGQPVVGLLTPGDQTYEARKTGAPADDVAAGIATHMAALSHEFVGSLFVTVAIHGKDGDSLRHRRTFSFFFLKKLFSWFFSMKKNSLRHRRTFSESTLCSESIWQMY